MNVIIIEDEKLSAEHLANLLVKIDASAKVIEVYDSVKKTIQAFKNGVKADLLFVDIHLADGLSFEIFSEISVDTPIIFTTAFDEYAIKAFKLNSVDYLLKPIGKKELAVALEKFQRLNSNSSKVFIDNIHNAFNTINKQYKSRFMVKIGDSISSVKCESILHFISEDGEVLILLDNGKRYVIDYTLDQLEGILSPDMFFRTNRKVILNISSVQKVSSYFNSRLKIQTPFLNDEESVVSRERVNEFKKWLDS